MTELKSFALALAAVLALTVPAAALTVQNTGGDDEVVAIMIGDDRAEVDVAAGSTVDLPCEDTCKVALVGDDGDGPEMDAKNGEALVIADSKLSKAE